MMRSALRVCSRCGVPKAKTEFGKGNKGRTKQYAYPYCKTCHKLQVEIHRLRRLFNITPEERDGLFAFQGNVCAMCGRPPGKNRLAIDHNHRTGLLRGGLCWLCNRLLGIVKDSVERLEKAAEYLKHPPALAYFSEPRYGRLGRTTSRAATVQKLEKKYAGAVAKEMDELNKYMLTKEEPAQCQNKVHLHSKKEKKRLTSSCKRIETLWALS
jgi:hypothetical protein